jgi:hypothetical protein
VTGSLTVLDIAASLSAADANRALGIRRGFTAGGEVIGNVIAIVIRPGPAPETRIAAASPQTRDSPGPRNARLLICAGVIVAGGRGDDGLFGGSRL